MPKSQHKTYYNINGTLVDADMTDVPTSRKFRDNWVLDGPVIDVDMDKAKDQVRDELREARKKPMEDNDLQLMLLMRKKEFMEPDAKDKEIAAEILVDQQRLRDVTKDPQIEACTTPEELEALKIL